MYFLIPQVEEVDNSQFNADIETSRMTRRFLAGFDVDELSKVCGEQEIAAFRCVVRVVAMVHSFRYIFSFFFEAALMERKCISVQS